MKTFIITLCIISSILLLTFGYQLANNQHSPALSPPLTLEQVLSIRELHLVRHTYNDMFLLHRKNNPTKAAVAIVQVPVEITAHLNLKNIELIKQGDSLQVVILPRATVSKPGYQLAQMTVRKTRGWQLYAGPHLYSQVSQYLQAALAERSAAVETRAMAEKIALQAETEGKEYVEYLLRCVGRDDVVVRFQ